MRLFLTFFSVLFSVTGAFSQKMKGKRKPPTIQFSFSLKDIYTPNLFSRSSFTDVLLNNRWTKVSEMAPGISISYLQGTLNPNIDFVGSINAAVTKHPFSDHSSIADSASKKLMVEASGGLNIKLLADNHIMVPYVYAGLGFSVYGGSYLAIYIPAWFGTAA